MGSNLWSSSVNVFANFERSLPSTEQVHNSTSAIEPLTKRKPTTPETATEKAIVTRNSSRYLDNSWDKNYSGTASNPGHLSNQQSLSETVALTNSTHQELPPIPNDAPFNFSACLLIMDDNKFLPEFIAYHFEVLPLRRLIVAVDPYSLTSPQHILDAWERLAGLHVTLWNDTDYMYNGKKAYQKIVTHANATLEERQMGHKWRQVTFLQSCAKQLRAEGLGWTLLADTDEFLTFNYFDKDPPSQNPANLYESGNPIQLMQELNITLPKIGEKTVAELLDDLYPWLQKKSQELCLVLPRSTIGATELPTSYQTDGPDESEGFDIKEFRTLRYRMYQNTQNLWPGKSILNVRIWKGHRLQGPHRALANCYEGLNPNPDATKSIFRLHHYSGSMEDFMSRPGDPHRSPGHFLGRNNFTWYGPLDDMVPWLKSFVKRIGRHRAHFLTVGLKQWAKQNDLERIREKYPDWNCSAQAQTSPNQMTNCRWQSVR